jgi:transcriptional regulator with XRE-family HTH domain
MMAKKAPNPIDRHVGSRVRMRRMMLNMSQEKLGDALGLTFQQVQKYEKGTNRIGASRLQQISLILQVPVSFFFEGAPSVPGSPTDGMGDAPSPAYGRQAAPPHRRPGRADRGRRRDLTRRARKDVTRADWFPAGFAHPAHTLTAVADAATNPLIVFGDAD